MFSRQEFWETMKILVEKDFKRNIIEDVTDWVENIIKKWVSNSEDDDTDNSVATKKQRLSECSGIDIELDEEVQRFLKALEKKMKKVDCRYK